MKSIFNRSRIGLRMGLAFAAVIAVTVIAAVFNLVQLRIVQNNADEMTGDQALRTALAYQWRDDIAQNAGRSVMLGMTTDTNLAQTLTAKIKATSDETSLIQKRFEAAEKTSEGVALQANLAQVRNRYLSQREAMLKSGGESVMAAMERGKAVSAFTVVGDEYSAAADKLVAYEQKRANADGSQISSALKLSSSVSVVCTLVSVATSIILGILLTRSITRPLATAQEAARRISEGDLTGTYSTGGDDEPARLLKSLGGMQDALREIVQDIRRATESIHVASAEVATGNMELSNRTEQTAGSLQQAASSSTLR